MKQRRRERGLSVLEVLIALAIVSMVMVLLSQLLLTAQAEVGRSGRRLVDPQVDLLMSRLRLELRSAEPVTPPFGLGDLWTDEPLEIRRPGVAHRTVYYLDGETLRRDHFNPGEFAAFSETVALLEAKSFRWRTVSGTGGRAVEVQVGWDETPHRVGVVVSLGQAESSIPIRRTARILVFTRGAGARTW